MAVINQLPHAGGGGGLETLTDGLILYSVRTIRGLQSQDAPYIWIYNPEYIEVTSGGTGSSLTFTMKKTVTGKLYRGQYNGNNNFTGQPSSGAVVATVTLTAGNSYTANAGANSGADTNYASVAFIEV